MNNFKRSPFVPLVIGFIAGIFAEYSYDFDLLVLVGFTLFLTLLIGIHKILPLNFQFKVEPYLGIVYFLLIVGVGAMTLKYHAQKQFEITSEQKIYYCIIQDIPEETENSISTKLKIKAIKKSNSWKNLNIKTLAYFEKDSMAYEINPGDEILFKSRLNQVENYGNPNEFDYQKYLSIHSVRHQTYISSGKWKKTSFKNSFSLRAYSNSVRYKLINRLKQSSLKREEYAVASALILGHKDYLSRELKQKFSSSGAMHILAVSGLHVGIIYFLFHYLFVFMDRNSRTRVVKTIIIVIFLWGYAFLTGLSPSVSRATLMFTLIAVGNSLNRETSVYNSLAFSAFILLLFNPLLIFSVGFQLSYLAVVSIVFFQPRIYKLIKLPLIPDKLWQWMTVAIAAQIGTAPLTIHYFNQFPNYFWLTNFVAIPAASLIIITGIAFFAFLPVSGLLSRWMAEILNKIILSLNYLIDKINTLPLSVTKDLRVDDVQLLLSYFLIASFSLLLLTKRARHLFYILTLIILLIGWDIFNCKKARNHKEFVVYNIPGKSIYNYLSNNENLLIYETFHKTEKNIAEQITFFTGNHWVSTNSPEPKYISFSKRSTNEINQSDEYLVRNNFICLPGTKLYVPVKKMDVTNYNGKKLKLDYLIIYKKTQTSLKSITSLFHFKQIILDSSIPYYQRKKWVKTLKNNHIPYYDVSEKGAFRLEIDQKKH